MCRASVRSVTAPSGSPPWSLRSPRAKSSSAVSGAGVGRGSRGEAGSVMFLGYNTNGFAHHRLADALAVLAELGYDGVALTLDHNALDPFADDRPQQVERVRRLLQHYRLRCVVETGARFLLDPRRKHRPTLLSPEPEQRQLRLHFLRQAVEIAAGLEADVVSFWSGA